MDADGLVVEVPALYVVIEPPETEGVEVETEPDIVESEGEIVEAEPESVVKWPLEEMVEAE